MTVCFMVCLFILLLVCKIVTKVFHLFQHHNFFSVYLQKTIAPHRGIVPDAVLCMLQNVKIFTEKRRLSVDNLAVLVSVFRDE